MAMKSLWMLLISLAVAGATSRGMAQYGGAAFNVDAREVIHNDTTRTDVVKDPLTHQMTEVTYDSRGVVISQKKYLLNDNGDPTQGQIFDGAGNLIARVQFVFDDLQRLSEERCVNLQGELFRRVLHQYDPTGAPLPLKAMDYKTRAPNMQTATIDFTHGSHGARPLPASTKPVQPGSTPQIESVSPTTGQSFAVDPSQAAAAQQIQQMQAQQSAAAKAADEKKKKKGGFFGLFKKKDSDGN
jgi:hypothetical protein